MYIVKKSIQTILLASCVLLAMAGCGPSNKTPPGPSDGILAKEMLVRMLDHWKSGGAITDLKTLNPAIFASDEDWSAGRTLVEYKLQGEPEIFGNDLHCRVQLKLNHQGASQSKVALYTISTVPAISIVRSDMTE